jgi:hypothetical protein
MYSVGSDIKETKKRDVKNGIFAGGAKTKPDGNR